MSFPVLCSAKRQTESFRLKFLLQLLGEFGHRDRHVSNLRLQNYLKCERTCTIGQKERARQCRSLFVFWLKMRGFFYQNLLLMIVPLSEAQESNETRELVISTLHKECLFKDLHWQLRRRAR